MPPRPSLGARQRLVGRRSRAFPRHGGASSPPSPSSSPRRLREFPRLLRRRLHHRRGLLLARSRRPRSSTPRARPLPRPTPPTPRRARARARAVADAIDGVDATALPRDRARAHERVAVWGVSARVSCLSCRVASRRWPGAPTAPVDVARESPCRTRCTGRRTRPPGWTTR